jgi:hypothetical protein
MPSSPCSIAVRPYDADAAAACLDLIRRTRSSATLDRRTTEFWNWKHASNPFGASQGLYAVDANGAVIGLRIFMRWVLGHPDGRTIIAARAVDTATRQEYRRQGVFRTLTSEALPRLAADRVEVVFNTPNQTSLRGYLQLGWTPPHRRALYFQVLDPVRFAARALQRSSKADGTPLWTGCFRADVPAWDEFSNVFGDQIAEVTASWEASRPSTGLRTPRTPEYLNWRYGRASGLSYGVIASVDGGGRLDGFVVVRPNRRYGCHEALLVEIVLREPSLSRGRRLLAETRRRTSAAWIVAHAAPGTLERRMLLRSRFHRWPRNSIPFVSRRLAGDAAASRDAAVWDLSLGDLEIF